MKKWSGKSAFVGVPGMEGCLDVDVDWAGPLSNGVVDVCRSVGGGGNIG